MTDEEIVALYLARDEKAVDHTAEKYGNFCTQIAMQIVGSAPDAEECVNDTWLRVWQTIPPQKPTSLKTYVARLVRHLSIDRYRAMHRQKRNCAMTEALDELTQCTPSEPPEGQENALAEHLNTFLDSLSALDRDLFMGRYWYLYSVKSMAAHHDMTETAVSTRLHRTREKLRTYLVGLGYRL